MNNTPTPQPVTLAPDSRKRWQEPRVVLERSLEVTAQDGGPLGPFGPLTST